MRWLRVACGGLGILLLVAGCTVVEKRESPVSYRLELDTNTVPRRTTGESILRIARPEGTAGVNTRGIAYRTEPHQLRYYTKSRWADLPTRMLETELVRAFEQSGLFRAVVDDTNVPADYLLTTQLLRLEHHVPEDGDGEVEVELRLQLIDLPERELLGSRVITATAAASSKDAAGAVAAAGAAMSQAVVDAVRTVEQARPAPPAR